MSEEVAVDRSVAGAKGKPPTSRSEDRVHKEHHRNVTGGLARAAVFGVSDGLLLCARGADLERGRDAVMINCNPETVSTDYDTSDRLYFEPLTSRTCSAYARSSSPRGSSFSSAARRR